MYTTKNPLMFVLISAQVVLSLFVGIFSSKIENFVNIDSTLVVIITLISLVIMAVVTFTIWLLDQPHAQPHANVPVRFWTTWKAERALMMIPVGLVFGAFMAVVTVPFFSDPVPLFFTINERVHVGLSLFLLYELYGVTIGLIVSWCVAIVWHKMGGLFFLLSFIISFPSMYTALEPDLHNLLLTIWGWGIPAVLLFLLMLGIGALFSK
jgi:hypothetical protein